ncbi:TetR/AcrR family transcriptional regulator [Marinomonas balearica]|uniref:TetR family transcriptional regulator n=1 Tax=Marinomonas balearica TaxID=491947 RepID=A0A4R6M810_9GAMM|nr:TetR/AcrR family transcriptional regulator [Marinomonas balearica]TDO96780.1 TetR family transcriptional regulator [Marinomonas balearica]
MKSPNKRTLTHNRLRTAVQKMVLGSKWQEVTVQDIAKDADVSIGTFYNYYDSKDEALKDVRQCLSELLFKDISILVNTQSNAIEKLAILFKYFATLVSSKPSWADYLFRGAAFDERLEGGLQSLIIPMLLEGSKDNVFRVDNVKLAASFLEQGAFPIIKKAYEDGLTLNDKDIAVIAKLILSTVGVAEDQLDTVSNQICPVTPLAPLPVSILNYARQTTIGYV